MFPVGPELSLLYVITVHGSICSCHGDDGNVHGMLKGLNFRTCTDFGIGTGKIRWQRLVSYPLTQVRFLVYLVELSIGISGSGSISPA